MPSYSYRCTAGCIYDARFDMAAVPREMECRVCGSEAHKLITAPYLSRAGGSALGLIESSARSAHEPEVVSQLPQQGRKRTQPVTTNPMHQKLPRD